MDPAPTPLAPALRALVDRSDGLAEVVDPETQRVFVVVEKAPPIDYGAPPEQSMIGKTKAEIDAMIEAGLASGVAGEVNDDFWAERRAALESRLAQNAHRRNGS